MLTREAVSKVKVTWLCRSCKQLVINSC